MKRLGIVHVLLVILFLKCGLIVMNGIVHLVGLFFTVAINWRLAIVFIMKCDLVGSWTHKSCSLQNSPKMLEILKTKAIKSLEREWALNYLER